MKRRGRFHWAVVLSALTTIAVLFTPSGASAHAIVASSQPEAGQRLGTAPGVVVLEFTEPINGKLSRATVTDPTHRQFTGSATGQEIRVPLRTNAPGVYTVQWVSVSTRDGHAVRGSFQFGVGVLAASSGETTQTSPRAGDLALAVLRWIEYLALLLAVGMLLVRRLARGAAELDWVRPRIRFSLVVALASGLAVVIWEAFSAAGAVSLSSFWSYLSTGLPGVARLSRIGLEILALVAAIALAPTLWMWVAAAIVALAASGHGAALHPTWWGIAVDAVHLLAAGVWAGGILALSIQRPPGGWRSPAGRALLVRFSPPALTAFAVTVGFGAIQAVQELGTAHALTGSSYGRVLLAKIGLVGLMIPVSLMAWRLRRPHLRVEGTLAVFVVAAAAILSAFPIPPSRLVEEEAARRATPSAAALPQPGELTLGGNAGQVLVGLTLRPGRPGPNHVVVYVLPLEGNKAAAPLEATLVVAGRRVALDACGDTCRRADVSLGGDQSVAIEVAGPKGGTATFEIPQLPAPDGSVLLAKAQTRMHTLRTYRQFETLSSGIATIPGRYAFQAPDRMESAVNRQSHTVWIGDTRYLKDKPGAQWQVEPGGPPIPVPSFIWDYFKPFVDARIGAQGQVDGVRTTVVTFAGGKKGTPIWFRLWIDAQGLVRHAEMRAPGHFMDQHFYDFDASFTIRAPTG